MTVDLGRQTILSKRWVGLKMGDDVKVEPLNPQEMDALKRYVRDEGLATRQDVSTF